MPNISKVCRGCGKEKSIDQFYQHPDTRDGFLNYCKECKKKDSRQYKAMKSTDTSWMEKERARWAVNGRRPERLEQNRDWRLRNPDKYTAYNKVNNACRDGKIQRSKVCEECGQETFCYAHHTDYAKPLKVVWLCTLCHKKVHKEGEIHVPF